MEIQHFNPEGKGFFKAMEDKREMGRMTYSQAGNDKIIIDHLLRDTEKLLLLLKLKAKE